MSRPIPPRPESHTGCRGPTLTSTEVGGGTMGTNTYYYITPANFVPPSGASSAPSQPAAPRARATQQAAPAEPKRRAAPAGDPPDDDDGEDGESYSYTYDTEEDDEEAEVPPPAEPPAEPKPKPQPKKEERSPLPRRRKQKESAEREQDDVSSVATADLKDMLAGKMKKDERGKPALSQVKLEEFHGSRSHYQDWKRVLQAQQALFNLKEEALAMIVFLSCHGEARMILSQLEISDMSKPGGLRKMLQLLEEAFGSRSDEKFEEKQELYLAYRRAAGQSVASYIAGLKRLKAEYLKQDPGTTISEKAFSQRMLARASLTRRERMDVFFSAGGRYRASDIERVLRFRCGQMHLDERRGGSGRDRDERPGQSSSSTMAPKSYFRRMHPHPRGDRRYHSSTRHGQRWKKVYFNEDEEWYDEEEEAAPTDEEDLEQEVYEGRHADTYYGDDDHYHEADDGWWSHNYWQDQYWDEEDDEELQQASMNDLSGLCCGLDRQGSVGRPTEGPRLHQGQLQRCWQEWRQETAIGQAHDRGPQEIQHVFILRADGHWRGDAQCPKVQRGEDQLREKSEVHLNETHVVTQAKTPTSPPSTSPEPARAKARVQASKEEITEEEPQMKTHKINWTLMVNNPLGRRLSGYQSDPDSPSEESHDSEHDSDFTMLTSNAGDRSSRRPKRSEFKLALETVLKALEDDSEEEEKLRRRLRKDKKEVKVSAQEMMAALPHMSKEEKKELYRKPVSQESLRRPAEAAGYSTGRASAPARASTDPPAAPVPPPPEIPKPMRKKQLQEFRKSLWEECLRPKRQLCAFPGFRCAGRDPADMQA